MRRRGEDDPQTLFNLAASYQDGIGVEKNAKKPMAVRLYQEAADQGSATSQFALACYYLNGGGVRDPKKAAALFQLAADQGNAYALNCLASCCRDGIGVEKDPKKAVALYQLAADQGHFGAQCSLAECYRYGIGVEKDPKKAFVSVGSR